MNTVFISGSRMLWLLNHQIKQCIDNLLSDGETVLVGDANGADRAIQKYLVQKKYQNVVVFCMQNNCRNNLGNWAIRVAIPQQKKKDSNYYRVKDNMMAAEANIGFVLWDGKSKGAFHNIVHLVASGKRTKVYFQPTDRIYQIDSSTEFDHFVSEFKLLEAAELKAIIYDVLCYKDMAKSKSCRRESRDFQGFLL